MKEGTYAQRHRPRLFGPGQAHVGEHRLDDGVVVILVEVKVRVGLEGRVAVREDGQAAVVVVVINEG